MLVEVLLDTASYLVFSTVETPGLTLIDARKSVGIALFCFAVYVSGIVSVEVVEEEEDDDDEYEEHDQWSNSNEEEKEPLVRFFPFPFTEELVHHPPYPLGSPERAAYRQLWKDPKKLNDIRGTYRARGARGRLRGSVARPAPKRRLLTFG